jgi:hypothetical protein
MRAPHPDHCHGDAGAGRERISTVLPIIAAIILLVTSRNIIVSVQRDSDDASGPTYPPGVASAMEMQTCSWLRNNDRPPQDPDQIDGHKRDADSLAADELLRHVDEVWFRNLRFVYSLSGSSLFDAYQHAAERSSERSIYMLHSSHHDRLTVFSALYQATRGTRFALRMPHDSREAGALQH